MNLTSLILIIIILLSFLALIHALTYNKIITYKIKIDKSEALIDEELRNKYDLIVKLNLAIKQVVTKKDYLKDYIELKDKRISNYEMDRKLNEAYNIILDVVADHEDLNNDNVNKDIKAIKKINENLISYKNYYNKNTADLNLIIRKFPTNFVARVHKFKIKPFFDGKNMQDAVYDDFKL